MPSDAASNERGAGSPTYPECPACGRDDQAKPLTLSDLSPGVQYFPV